MLIYLLLAVRDPWSCRVRLGSPACVATEQEARGRRSRSPSTWWTLIYLRRWRFGERVLLLSTHSYRVRVYGYLWCSGIRCCSLVTSCYALTTRMLISCQAGVSCYTPANSHQRYHSVLLQDLKDHVLCLFVSSSKDAAQSRKTQMHRRRVIFIFYYWSHYGFSSHLY